jgi:hypothetical protein
MAARMHLVVTEENHVRCVHNLRLATPRAVGVGHHRMPDGHAVSQAIQHTGLFQFNSNGEDPRNRQQALKILGMMLLACAGKCSENRNLRRHGRGHSLGQGTFAYSLDPPGDGSGVTHGFVRACRGTFTTSMRRAQAQAPAKLLSPSTSTRRGRSRDRLLIQTVWLMASCAPGTEPSPLSLLRAASSHVHTSSRAVQRFQRLTARGSCALSKLQLHGVFPQPLASAKG